MWKINSRGQVKQIQYAYDQFVSDFFSYLDKLHGRLDPELTWLLGQAPGKLGILINNTDNVKKYLKHFSKVRDLNRIKDAYNLAIEDYKSMIDKGYVIFHPCGFCNKKGCSSNYCSRELVKDAFVYFYDLIGTKAFADAYIPSLSSNNLKQTYGKKWNEIRKTCPYCDRKSISHSSDRSIDHYLPNKKVPLLSIHSMNLVVSCSSCNDRLKNEKIELPSYHPYFDQIADKFAFDFIFLDFKENPNISVTILGDPIKMNNYLRVFELEDVYNSISWKIKNEFEMLSNNIKSDYRQAIAMKRLSGRGRGTGVNFHTLRKVTARHVRKKLKENISGRGKEENVKLMRDFYIYVHKNSDNIVGYIATLV